MTNVRAYIHPRDFPLDRIFMSQADVMRRNPQRHEFLQLESILHCDLAANLIVGHRKVRADEFWVRGHLPGRPLLPGVMMCETLAQVASIHAHLELKLEEKVFMGFGALDKVRFRASVEPPCDLWVAGKILKASARRPYFSWGGQLLSADGAIVAEGEIVGVGM